VGNFTHKQLCEIGAKWLIKVISWKYRCNYVVSEFASMCSEQPDIFGLRGGEHTIMIEVKISRSDFLADFKKEHRQTKYGIGKQRYYLCETNLINIDELPLKWGLLYCDENKNITIIKESEHFTDVNIDGEMRIMYSIIRRLSKKRQVFDFKSAVAKIF